MKTKTKSLSIVRIACGGFDEDSWLFAMRTPKWIKIISYSISFNKFLFATRTHMPRHCDCRSLLRDYAILRLFQQQKHKKKKIKLKSQWTERIVFIQWMANQCWFSLKHQRNYSSAVHAASERQPEYAKWKAAVPLPRTHSQSSHQWPRHRLSNEITGNRVDGGKRNVYAFRFHRDSIRTYILTLFTHEPTDNERKKDISFPFSVPKIANVALCVRVRGLHSRGVDETRASKILKKKKKMSFSLFSNTTGKFTLHGNRKLRHACTKWKWNRHAPISVDTFFTGPDDGTWHHRRCQHHRAMPW